MFNRYVPYMHAFHMLLQNMFSIIRYEEAPYILLCWRFCWKPNVMGTRIIVAYAGAHIRAGVSKQP